MRNSKELGKKYARKSKELGKKECKKDCKELGKKLNTYVHTYMYMLTRGSMGLLQTSEAISSSAERA